MAGKDDIQNTGPTLSVDSRVSRPAHSGVFFKEGEFWTIGYDGDSFGLRHSKGLAYLAQLLRYPGTEFHALDLAGGTAAAAAGELIELSSKKQSSLPRSGTALASAGIHVGGFGDAGEMLDEQAKAQYRRRLEELRDELDEAKELGNVDRAARAEAEIDALTAELSRAIGLGGRSRRAASASERARQSVTHAIKSAIERIEENHAYLGGLLSRGVKTGALCSYNPDATNVVQWEFGASGEQRAASVPFPAEVASSDAPAVEALRELTSLAELRRTRTQMVGRQAEEERLRNLAEQARKGSGTVILLGGGPGVGKTRLSLEFLTQALPRGFAHFIGRCYERDQPHPLMPFVEIIEAAITQATTIENLRARLGENAAELTQIAPGLRRVFPDAAAPPELPTAQVRRYLFQSLFDFIARMSKARPLLLVLDDLHWADESTLAMLNFLARRLEHVPVLVLAIYRDEGLDVTRPLNRTLEELLRLGIPSIKLAGLSRGGVAEMLANLSGREPPVDLISLIFEETQGNPFFVEEVFSHLREEGRIFDAAGNFREASDAGELSVPDNVRLVLTRRIERTTNNARDVLSAAAIIGRSFSFRLLEGVLDKMEADSLFAGLEEAERAGFITSNSEDPEAPFVFSHELVRQTLLAAMSKPRQQRLHWKVGQVLEELYGTQSENRAAELAHHLLQSGPFGDPGKASYYLSLAGQSHLGAGALEDARRVLNAALTYRQEDPAKRAATLTNLAFAERGLGDWEAAIGHLQECLALYARVNDLRSVGRVVFGMVEAFVWTGHFDEAVAIAERGLDHLRVDEAMHRARLLAALGYIHAVRGNFSAAMKAYDEALASPAVAPFQARVLAYRSISYLYFFKVHEALEDSRKSAAMSNPQDTPWTHSAALSVVMRSLYYSGKPDQALTMATELELMARGVGELAALSDSAAIRAWADFGRNPDLALLEQRISKAVAFNRETRLSLFLTPSLAQMSMVKFLAGDWDSARSIAEEAQASEVRGVAAGLGTGMLLRLAAYSGDRDEVIGLFDGVCSDLPIPERPNTRGAWLLMVAVTEALAMVGDKRAAKFYPQVRELISSGVVSMLSPCRFTETIAGIAAIAADDWDSAEKHFSVALRQAMEMPHRLEQAEVRRFHAMALLRRNSPGDRARAKGMLVHCAESYEAIGMPRHRDLAHRLLAQKMS